MTLTEQVYAQAVLLVGELEAKQSRLLQLLCASATSTLTAQLREGLQPEDCKADFVAAASLMALAGLNPLSESNQVEQLQAGDLTIRRGEGGKDAASRCLRRQAELMISPYLKDQFTFLGV